ncbi:MAG: hypothetical protein PWR27_2186 [Petroclostridium sp.]|nr:hypothetical protein [Petroclostridium sp.]
METGYAGAAKYNSRKGKSIMKAISINVKPFSMIEILDCQIKKEVNEHMLAYISGYISEKDVLGKFTPDTEITIEITDEDGEIHTIFRGLPDKISNTEEGYLTKLEIHAISKTTLLDTEEKVRFFYNKNQTYKEIVRYIVSENENASVIMNHVSEQSCNIIAQYGETDWFFLKRLASCLNTVLVPDCTNSHICFFFGLPTKDDVELDVEFYEVNITDHVREYIVESREILNLCTPVEFHGHRLYVHGIESRLYKQELIHKYCLREKQGFQVKPYGNEKIIGASFMGEVSKVKNDVVRINCNYGCKVNNEDTVWFPFASVYSSPEGTGWYCMPEKGDRIRIHFPDENANQSYVINAVHTESDGDMRKNPEEKSIRTKHDKEIRFTPEKIMITNHKGLSIVLDDEKGIMINSNRVVKITASESVEFASGGETSIVAGRGIIFRENNNSLMISDGISHTGLTIQYQ